MKRIILLSLCLLLCLSAAHAQKLAIKGLSTQSIQIGNKTLTKGNVFNANEKIHWSVKGQSMRLMFQDGEKRGLFITVCREAMERIGAENVTQYLCWCNQTWFERFKSNFGLIVNNKPSSRSSVELMEKTASNFPEKRLALVIGNSNYEYLDPLANPLNDVTKVAEKLQSLGFDVLPVYDADDREINSKFNWLKRQSKYDVVVVYYSGHGIQNGNKQYLIPVNGKLDDENDLDYCISLEDVYESLNALGKDKTKMIFVDACRNQGKWQSKIEADSRQEGEDIAVLYSTSTGSKASDGEAGENSPFAQAFLEEIGNPTDNVTTTIGKIKNAVKEKSNQIPIDINFTGQTFTFNPHGTEKTQQAGISLITNMDVIRNVAEGRINAEQLGFDAQKFLGYSNVDISTSVTSILDYGFKDCDELYSISIPETLTSIGLGVFDGCNNLCKIEIAPDNPIYDSRDNCNAIIETSSNTLIAGCSATIIPKSVTSIGDMAFKGCSGLTSITIPNSVTSIGESAFNGCDGLTSVNIPNSVTSIGYCAFEDCSNLTSVTIPNSVTTIGEDAFRGCSGLTSVTIPNSVSIIENGVFGDCSGLTSVTIPNSVTSIGEWAFNGCTGLTSVNIPNSVTSIGEWAFWDCSNLTSVTIPNSVTTIGEHAFRGCSGLTSVTIPNSVSIIENLVFGGCSGLTSVTIPNSVTSIGNYAFSGCSGMTSVTIPNSVTSIGNHAFARCSGLTSVTIPNSVTSIGNEAFRDCDGLTSIQVDKDNNMYDSRDKCNAIIETSSNTLIVGCKSSIIPNTVTSVGESAFEDCSGLTSVNIPNSVTSIGDDAFSGCSGLTSVTIPKSVTTIGEHAFRGCSGLTSVTIPKSVTSIGEGAFDGCTDLVYVTIPESVKQIGSGAFEGTSWYDMQPDGLIYVGNVAYKYKGEMPEGTTINLKEGTASIADEAFEGCSGLTSVTIPNSVTSIGDGAFRGCTGLTSVNIPNSVTSIGESAFEDCSGLTSVNIPNSVTSIGESAFRGCTGLTSVTIPNSVTIIGGYAFEDSPWFNSLPDGLIYLGRVAYKYRGNNHKMVEVAIKEGTTSIGDEAFQDCKDLTNISIPSSVTHIGNLAFDNCTGLTSIIIPNSVLYIGLNAFDTCNGLEDFYISNKTPPEYEWDWYYGESYGIPESCTLHVPKGCKEAYENKDPWCYFDNIIDDL